jgi:hypothetical protein
MDLSSKDATPQDGADGPETTHNRSVASSGLLCDSGPCQQSVSTPASFGHAQHRVAFIDKCAELR